MISLLVIILIIFLIFGGGYGYRSGFYAHSPFPYFGGMIVLILIILLVLVLVPGPYFWWYRGAP